MEMTTAQTIVNQIGNGALVMLGARDLLSGDNALQFSVGRMECLDQRVVERQRLLDVERAC